MMSRRYRMCSNETTHPWPSVDNRCHTLSQLLPHDAASVATIPTLPPKQLEHISDDRCRENTDCKHRILITKYVHKFSHP